MLTFHSASLDDSLTLALSISVYHFALFTRSYSVWLKVKPLLAGQNHYAQHVAVMTYVTETVPKQSTVFLKLC